MDRKYKLGIDVGGTFTDGVLLNMETGQVVNFKVSSTPKDPSIGFLCNLDGILERSGIDPRAIWFLVHGTTVATNAIIEGKTSKTALITTGGFRDILEIAFQIRPKLYDLFTEKPSPLVPRELCFEVSERMSHTGEILMPLDPASIDAVIEQLKESGVESVAICLLHSYVNSAHETQIKEQLQDRCPNLFITLSSEICPEFREYTRASTTVINSCIMPIVSRYVERIEYGLKERGVTCDCHLMQSSGGVVRSQIAKAEPCKIIESGPAAGVIAASYIATRIGIQNCLCIDIGGTTAKIGLILDGQPHISTELEVGAAAFVRSTARRASGYPLRTPTVDLVEIGAGGGSLAWVDSGGILRVGPQSAGADPGPACYPNGGDRPTLTDANLILGRLNPNYFLGGTMKLSRERALEAVRTHCSRKLQRNEIETAAAILDVTVSNMVNAIRFISVERGYDPRELALVTTGGAGPLHSNLIAAELAVPTVVIPLSPGLASALGLLVTDIKQEASKTVLTVKDLSWPKVQQIIGSLADEVRSLLRQQGVRDEEISIFPVAYMRYSGQSYELSVPFDFDRIAEMDLDQLTALFNREHERAYGFFVQNEETVIVTLKVTGVGLVPKHNPPLLPEGSSRPSKTALKDHRPVYLGQMDGVTDCPIYDRGRLKPNNRLLGPAIVEEVDSTTLILPAYQGWVDRQGNLIIMSA